jgi:hypothetical protein
MDRRSGPPISGTSVVRNSGNNGTAIDVGGAPAGATNLHA